MRKLFALVFAALMLLTACGETAQKESEGPHTVEPAPVVLTDETSVINTNTHMYAQGGEFYTEQVMTAQFADFRLNFTDFDTLESTAICSKPNCPHDDPETCSAFGMGNHPVAVDGKIYFMKNDPEWGPEQAVKIYSADMDGTGRIKLAEIKNCASDSLTPIAIIGKTLYFTVSESEFNDDGFTESGLKTVRLCAFNCETNKAETLCEICRGYDTSAEIKGYFDGKLYVRASYKNEKQEPIDFSTATDEDWNAYIAEGQKITVNEYKVYDLAGGDLEEPPYDIDPLGEFFASGGILCFQTGEKSFIVRQGEDAVETDFIPNIGSCLVNGFLFSPFYGMALDTNTLEIRPLNADVVTSGDFVLDYRDGSYIVRTGIDYGSYRRVAPEEIFEEKR